MPPSEHLADESELHAHLDADAELGLRRLQGFIRAMIPIAIAFDVVYVVMALAWKSTAMVGGAVAVTIYVIALGWARYLIERGSVSRAALVTGSALLVMIAIGAVVVPFELAALVLIAIAALVVVLPHIQRRALIVFALATVAVIIEIVILDGIMTPLLQQPPLWFEHIVLASAVVAASTLIVVMLYSDHERMRTLVSTSVASAAEAHRAREATETFLIAAAHQLRTPASTVLLQSETVLRDAGTDDRLKARAERLVRQATRLQQVVDMMLDVSRASVGTLELERQPLDLAALVRDVAGDHARSATDAGVTIGVEAPATLAMQGDRQRLALVTSSLLDHTIRRGGSRASISVREDGPIVELCVSGSGAGMTAEERAHCFDRDSQPSSRADGDLGVGLWLVRQLSEAMSGEVSAGDGRTAGTRFVVRIPRSMG